MSVHDSMSRYWEENHTQTELDSATLHWLLLTFNKATLERGYSAFNFRKHRGRSEIVYCAFAAFEVLALVLNLATLPYDTTATPREQAMGVLEGLYDPWSAVHLCFALALVALFFALWIERTVASGRCCCCTGCTLLQGERRAMRSTCIKAAPCYQLAWQFVLATTLCAISMTYMRVFVAVNPISADDADGDPNVEFDAGLSLGAKPATFLGLAGVIGGLRWPFDLVGIVVITVDFCFEIALYTGIARAPFALLQVVCLAVMLAFYARHNSIVERSAFLRVARLRRANVSADVLIRENPFSRWNIGRWLAAAPSGESDGAQVDGDRGGASSRGGDFGVGSLNVDTQRSPLLTSDRWRDLGGVGDLGDDGCELSFMYRYIPRESRSQFDSLPLTSLTIPGPVRHTGRLSALSDIEFHDETGSTGFVARVSASLSTAIRPSASATRRDFAVGLGLESGLGGAAPGASSPRAGRGLRARGGSSAGQWGIAWRDLDVVSTVARGGGGTVFKAMWNGRQVGNRVAKDAEKRIPVAAKVLTSTVLEGDLSEVAREASAMAALSNHAHIATLLGLTKREEEDGGLVVDGAAWGGTRARRADDGGSVRGFAVLIVTEWADLGDLAAFVSDAGAFGGSIVSADPGSAGEGSDSRAAAALSARNELATEVLSELARQVASALAFLHAHRVLHRDIKPANILLTTTDASCGDAVQLPSGAFAKAIVTDFGLATVLVAGGSSGSAAEEAIGTPLYMAPETRRVSGGGAWYDSSVSSGSGGSDDGGAFARASKVDVYAFGVTLAAIFTSDEPFGVLAHSEHGGEGGSWKTPQKRLATLEARIADPWERLRPDAVECAHALQRKMPPPLVALARRCWDHGAMRRPEFSEISAVIAQCVDWRRRNPPAGAGGELEQARRRV
jgi:serine/threonine protein kinase